MSQGRLTSALGAAAAAVAAIAAGIWLALAWQGSGEPLVAALPQGAGATVMTAFPAPVVTAPALAAPDVAAPAQLVQFAPVPAGATSAGAAQPSRRATLPYPRHSGR